MLTSLTRIGKHLVDLSKLTYISPIFSVGTPKMTEVKKFSVHINGSEINISEKEVDNIEDTHQKLERLFKIQPLGQL